MTQKAQMFLALTCRLTPPPSLPGRGEVIGDMLIFTKYFSARTEFQPRTNGNPAAQ